MAADTSVILRRDPVEKQWVVVPLADPAGDRLFWFNGSSGIPDYLSIGSGLVISGSSLSGQHNAMPDLEGGAVGEYFHLTSSEHDAATRIASASQSGLLSSTDWSTFNSKQTAYNNLSAIGQLANGSGWLLNDGSGSFSYTTPSKSDVGLGNVENTALSTWAGSTNVTTLGTVATGTWQGSTIGVGYGGTGLSSIASGKLLYASAANTLAELSLGYGLNVSGGTLYTPQDLRTSASPTFAGLQSEYITMAGAANPVFKGSISNRNYFIGEYVAMGGASGIYNAAFGYAALNALSSGNGNMAIGAASLAKNTTGYNNTAIGYSAGYSDSIDLATNNNCTFIGYGTVSTSDGFTNSTALGAGATITASNQMVFGNMDVTQNIFSGSIKTASPYGGTAQPVKFGSYVAGAPTATGYQQIEINGTAYKVLVST